MKGLTTIILFLVSIKIFSCECQHLSFDNELKTSTYIFSGLILSKENNINKTQDNSFNLPIKYRVLIEDKWKGELKDTIDLYSGLGGGDCGILLNNKTYIIWATIANGFLETSRCTRTCLLDDSPDIDRLNNIFKEYTYDTTYLTTNEIKVIKKRIQTDTIDLSKTVLFISNNKLLSKMDLMDALLYEGLIEFITIPSEKLKTLPDKATKGVLIVKGYDTQKANMNKIIKTIKRSSRQEYLAAKRKY